jgi:DNA-binding response OmpR family regulator
MKVLLIEDESQLAASIVKYLTGSNVKCEWAKDAASAIERISSFEYDCVVLDLMLPDGSGFDVLKLLKELGKSEGVIITSAKDSIDSRILGLQSGADDYLIKPFHLSELLARIQALVRRKNFNGSNPIRFNEIEIDLQAKAATVNGISITLTKKEFELLLYLVGNKNRVLSKNAIAEHLSGDLADMLPSHDFIYAHMKNLKKKLAEAGTGDYIKTVYGVGYKWQ